MTTFIFSWLWIESFYILIVTTLTATVHGSVTPNRHHTTQLSGCDKLTTISHPFSVTLIVQKYIQKFVQVDKFMKSESEQLLMSLF